MYKFLCNINGLESDLFSVQEEKAMQLVPTKPIDQAQFVAYVQERKKKKILFKGEYMVNIFFCINFSIGIASLNSTYTIKLRKLRIIRREQIHTFLKQIIQLKVSITLSL